MDTTLQRNKLPNFFEIIKEACNFYKNNFLILFFLSLISCAKIFIKIIYDMVSVVTLQSFLNTMTPAFNSIFLVVGVMFPLCASLLIIKK